LGRQICEFPFRTCESGDTCEIEISTGNSISQVQHFHPRHIRQCLPLGLPHYSPARPIERHPIYPLPHMWTVHQQPRPIILIQLLIELNLFTLWTSLWSALHQPVRLPINHLQTAQRLHPVGFGVTPIFHGGTPQSLSPVSLFLVTLLPRSIHPIPPRHSLPRRCRRICSSSSPVGRGRWRIVPRRRVEVMHASADRGQRYPSRCSWPFRTRCRCACSRVCSSKRNPS
jgi:hypothetical protein